MHNYIQDPANGTTLGTPMHPTASMEPAGSDDPWAHPRAQPPSPVGVTEPPHIVIVEDDVALARSLRRLLIGDGLAVSLAFGGEELRRLLARGDVDLVLLDLNLGVEDGMDIARELGPQRAIGLIIVTGRGEASDCVTGLDAGADDYVTKPFDHEILRARIRAVLRRRQRGRDALPVLAIGPYRLNTVDRCLSREGDPRQVELTARETSLLAYLIANAGNPIHRADLARNGAWNPDDRATDVHISHIRRKLQAAGMSDLCVKPVRGFGYQLSLPQQVPEPSETCPPG